MRLNRRDLLLLAALAAGQISPARLAQAVEPDDSTDLLEDADYPAVPPEFDFFGYRPPDEKQVRISRQIIDNARGQTPIAVARYFISDAVDPHYRNAWRAQEPWNPVILHFLKASGYRASDDMVPWCAGFVNFCLWKAGYQTSGSASSQSFLHNSFFDEAQPPQEGDIAVFSFVDDHDARTGFGHVAFVLKADRDLIHTLGGNQTGHGVHGITQAAFHYASPRPVPRCIERSKSGCTRTVTGRLKLAAFVRPKRR